MPSQTIKTTLLAVAALCATAATAQDNAGSYLAGRQAATSNDFAVVETYFREALRDDASNPFLLETLLASQVALGDIEAAGETAQRMVDMDVSGQVSNLVLTALAAKQGNWTALMESFESGQSVSPLVDGLAQAWAALGRGDMGAAIESFDAVIETEGMTAYGEYHKALALAAVGDFEGAEAILSSPPRGGAYSARAAFAHAKVLSQLDRNEDALQMLEAVFGDARDPTLAALRADLEAGAKVPYDVVTNAEQGIGEVAFMIGGLLQGETPDAYTLLYTRIAEYLDPDNTSAIISSADLLERLGRYELADAAFARVSPNDPAFATAELGRIDVLRRADRDEAAIEVAQGLARSHAELPNVHAKLGDVLRFNERYTEAVTAYDTALDLYAEDETSRWFVYYTRAITHHLLDQWPQAEADFRAALALNPDQAQVLNYLGYSLVERGEKLDEALQMIETAVADQPENGAIVDSLGWVYFQLGRYDDAVAPMEKAAALEATDPIINDHLGDVYWAVGRKIEAHFQWQRALSFDPDEELADRIRLKLEIGLDAVLEQEGADPIRVADDNG